MALFLARKARDHPAKESEQEQKTNVQQQQGQKIQADPSTILEEGSAEVKTSSAEDLKSTAKSEFCHWRILGRVRMQSLLLDQSFENVIFTTTTISF